MDQKFLPGFEGWNKPLIIEYFMTKNERQLIQNQDMNNYYMNPPFNHKPSPNYIPGIPPIPNPHFIPNQFHPGMYGQMFPHMPMPMRMPMIQFNNYNNYGHYNNYNNNYNNNFYYKNRGRGGKRFYNNKNNNRNYYKGPNNKYNKERKDNDEIKEEHIINTDNLFDMDEYEKLESEEAKKNYFGEKVYLAIEESQLAVDKKLNSDDIAKITGAKEEYVYNSGLENEFYKEIIIKYLNEYGSASRKEIIALLNDKLPKSLDNKNKISRVRYLLDTLKREGKIYNDAKSGGSCWKVK